MKRRFRACAGLVGAALALAIWAPVGHAQSGQQGTPAAATAPAAGSYEQSGSADEVYVLQRKADGSTYSAVYHPAPGVTADQLRARLTERGVSGVLPREKSTRAAIIAGCAPIVGTASAWCGHKWDYGPFNDPQVYFLDHTSDSWPVTDARVDWYQAPGIDAYYRWYTAGCPGGGRHCVHVYSGSYGTDWYGVTEATASNGLFGTVTVKLNDQVTPNTYAARRSVACHEMGHALGLDANLSTNSCMSDPEFPQHPSSDDFGVLNALYPRAGT